MERDPMELALSTDLVVDIVLSHLKVIDLLGCRLASKCWNKAASSILRKRSTMIKIIKDEETLGELEECMANSSDFPFAGFKFDEPWKLNSGRAIKFFEDYGARFTRLCLDTHCTGRLHVIAPFIHRLPRLSVLEMALPDSWPPNPLLKLLDSETELDDGQILNLSSLRTLRIFCPLVAEDVLGEVLMAASSSLQIECLTVTTDILGALKRAGKLGAVSFIKFCVHYGNGEHQSRIEGMEKFLSTESLSLTKLDFNADAHGCLSLAGLQKILFSSQHTLTEFYCHEIYMGSDLGDLWNNFPVLAKLTTLSLRICIHARLQYLFQSRLGRNFPALKEFKLIDSNCHCTVPGPSFPNCSFIVPSVTRMDIQGYVSEHAMRHLAQAFPNVTDIRLEYEHYYISRVLRYRDHYDNYGAIAKDQFEIWSVGAFRCLEILRIWNYRIEQPLKHHISMDSFLTGIPTGICNNLRPYKQWNLMESPFNEILRDNPNILQLENLKELIICLKPEDGLHELAEDPPFMSLISVWYALEMMPNLRTTFTYEMTSFSTDEERYRAVLGAALKHVWPYVTVEPFFY